MKLSILHGCKWRDRRGTALFIFYKNVAAVEAAADVAPMSPASFDLREEYASAFRTESYADFWARVLEQTAQRTTVHKSSSSSSIDRSGGAASARLPSCHLFVESLLEPDQATVTKLLSRARIGRKDDESHFLLVSDFFDETADASLLCGLLLGDIEKSRLCHRPIKKTLAGAPPDDPLDVSKAHKPVVVGALGLPHRRLRAVQLASARLLERLERGRGKARARLRLLKKVKRGLAVLFMALASATSAVGVGVALHVAVAFMAAAVPVLPPVLPFRLPSARRVWKALAQLDAAAKGAYILSRDLDTISRLVESVNDEAEHLVAMLRLCSERGRGRRWPAEELVRQLRRNDASFNRQLDELEEHLFLCFMTINRARSLVTKAMLL